MIEFISKFWIQTVLSGIVIFISTMSRLVFVRFQREFQEQDLIKNGVLAILHDRLYQACHFHIARNWITTSELNNVEHLYKAYHDLGGNGTGTELYSRCKSLPIRVEVLGDAR